MIRNTKKFAEIILTLSLLFVGSDAMAGMGGGTIAYSPVAQSIPTLSGSMLVVLTFLVAVLAFRILRAYPGNKPLASLLAVGVLSLAAASGNQLIQNAEAGMGFVFSNSAGGVVTVGSNGEYPVQNASGVPQQVISVTPNANNVSIHTTGSPQCTAGVVVQNNNSCYINFQPIPF